MKKIFKDVLKILVFFLGWVLLLGVVNITNSDPAIERFYLEFFPFIFMIIFTLVFLRIENGKVSIPIFNNALKGSAIGIITGVLWIIIPIGILYFTKNLEISKGNAVNKLWLWILSAFINVIMQEFLVRGYIYRLLKENYNLTTAIIVTTSLFTALHGGAFEAGIVPVINVVTMCLFTTALYEAEKTLLAPIMAHAVWNIVGSLIFGTVSLAEDYPELFSSVAKGNTLISGGDYKIEGSIIVMILNLILMIIFSVKCKNNASDKFSY